jgi:hypothetical protein
MHIVAGGIAVWHYGLIANLGLNKVNAKPKKM